MKNFIIQESAISHDIRNIEKTPLGTIRFIAVLQEADRCNRNKRIYPKQVLAEAIQSDYIKERLRTNSLYGEAGHPLDPSLARQTTIQQSNIAYLIEKLWWEGDLLMALCETANTSIGRDMAGLIEQGSQVAFSLRAQGGVNKDPISGISTVKPGMQIITWDWVVNPSHDKAFLQSICGETSQVMFGAQNVQEASHNVKQYELLFESGQIIELDEDAPVEIITEDYTRGYNKRLREFNEIYFYNKEDELLQESLKDGVVELKNGNTTKKVMLEDYMLQDLRNNICTLNEGVDERTPKNGKESA